MANKSSTKKKSSDKQAGKNMARRNTTEIAGVSDNTNMPAYMKENAARGQEGVGLDDLTIPRLDVIQSLSPQRNKNKPEYIEGAEEGGLFNTVTGHLYGEEVTFVPVFYRKEFIIWKDQNKGGGFCGAFQTMAEAQAEFDRRGYDDDEYEIVQTGNQFGMIVHDDGHLEEVVISMAKSKYKVNKKFNTLIKMAGGDRFSRAYKVSAVMETNNNNQDYYNIAITTLGFVTEDVFRAAEKMYEVIASGIRDVVRDGQTDYAGSTTSEDDEDEF